MDLFSLNLQNNLKRTQPLAEAMRPRTLDEVLGQEHLLGEGRYLRRAILADRVPSLILYGPPGVGKTTIAKVIAKVTSKNFFQISAVTSNLKEMREVLKSAEDALKFDNTSNILFIDEIHRFNKTQQDALLPFVEKGIVTLIGATTENPYFEVNKALLSRCQVLSLKALETEDIKKGLRHIIDTLNEPVDIDDKALDFLARASGGDMRRAINGLEIAVYSTPEVNGVITIDAQVMEDSIQEKQLIYDKDGNEHYDVISAFIKAMRGSDPDGALYYLARMLESGEDPRFIARRMMVLASEDVGNADPMALSVAAAAHYATTVIGLPECRLNLAQAVIYLACAPKSNRSYEGLNKAVDEVKHTSAAVPMYLRDRHNPNVDHDAKYLYPHNYPGSYVVQRYLPDTIQGGYYKPTNHGYEKQIKTYLESLNRSSQN
ncbi:replication-associated recombination protein A [Peptoniphilus equinus]|uniref:Replication-associated recombination protein A n=1 Tax=Peptoniphilus equinus TaxID=3016343 RepID=A0ABY7QR47_9FIRM|nr:replication-associated recombination protein A [Peptoniphilus equinus]WBW49264.1 replication-associated recombination protein A [Peptoniphilus equinus]